MGKNPFSGGFWAGRLFLGSPQPRGLRGSKASAGPTVDVIPWLATLDFAKCDRTQWFVKLHLLESWDGTRFWGLSPSRKRLQAKIWRAQPPPAEHTFWGVRAKNKKLQQDCFCSDSECLHSWARESVFPVWGARDGSGVLSLGQESHSAARDEQREISGRRSVTQKGRGAGTGSVVLGEETGSSFLAPLQGLRLGMNFTGWFKWGRTVPHTGWGWSISVSPGVG